MNRDVVIVGAVVLAFLYLTGKAKAASGGAPGTSTTPPTGVSSSASGSTSTNNCPSGSTQYTVYHAVSDYFAPACDPTGAVGNGAVIIVND